MALQRRTRLKRSVRPLLPLQGRCCGKKRFATEQAAQAALYRIARTTPRDEYPQRAYECRFGWWHLTKQVKRTGPAPTARELVLERDEYRCARCGVSIFAVLDYSVQHRRARGSGGTSDPARNLPSNLIVLCGSATSGCHLLCEQRNAEAEADGFVVSLNSDENPLEIPVEHKLHGRICLTDDGGWRPA